MARGKQLQTSLWGPELRALGGRESRCQIVRHHQLVFRVWWCISLLTTSHLARLPARLAGTAAPAAGACRLVITFYYRVNRINRGEEAEKVYAWSCHFHTA